jgi:single-strand DNA-binding protein
MTPDSELTGGRGRPVCRSGSRLFDLIFAARHEISSVLSFGSGHSFVPIPAPCGLRSFCFAGRRPTGSGSPILVPPEKQPLALGAVAARFRVPQNTRAEQEKNMYLNRLTLIGFIGADAEAKTSNRGSRFAVFSVATKRSWKNAQGSWESRSEWHHCLAFGKLGEFAVSLKKGAHVEVEGELRSREYEKDGVTHRVFECCVESILKLDRAARQESPDNGEELSS